MRKAWWLLGWLIGCGAGASEHESTTPEKAATKSIAEREAEKDNMVGVRGIEGSLSSYDVRMTMEEQGERFASCHERRANAVPPLAGEVELAIRVLGDGRVERVDIRGSSLGDRELERCLSEVVATTPFPRPHGGATNVTYTMLLDSARPTHLPEEWEVARIERLVSKRSDDVRSECGLAEQPYDVTVYVNPRGRVLAAGVASRADVSEAALDCIASALRSWKLPKPQKQRYAKVQFALSP